MKVQADRSWLRRWGAVVWTLTTAGAVSACSPATAALPPDVVRIATGSEGGIYHSLGTELAKAYASRLAGVVPTAQATAASAYNVHAVESDIAELAFALGDVTYLAYTKGTSSLPQPHHGLRAIAVLYENVTHILVRADSPIAEIADLRGQHVAVGRSLLLPRATRPLTIDVIAEAYGLRPTDFRSEWLTLPELISGLRDGRLAAGFFSSGYPVTAISAAAEEFGVRLLPVAREAAVRVRAVYPFFKLTSVPAGTYPAQRNDIPALAVDNLLICRDDLSDDLVYRLTRSFFESLPDIGQHIVAARLVNVDRAPTTPIPLHPGAARYYRERELLRW
jgi:TRAP transporter TAXI family solute receptor